MTLLRRDGLEVEALRTDRYLDALLAAADRHASDAPADTDLDPALRDVARRLGRDLARVHPSFRFEERLARRLAEAAAVAPAAAAVTAVSPIGALPADPALPAEPATDDPIAPLASRARPILIGGAMASAAISLAGAALVAWRLTRSPAPPMTRAARAAHLRAARARLD